MIKAEDHDKKMMKDHDKRCTVYLEAAEFWSADGLPKCSEIFLDPPPPPPPKKDISEQLNARRKFNIRILRLKLKIIDFKQTAFPKKD